MPRFRWRNIWPAWQLFRCIPHIFWNCSPLLVESWKIRSEINWPNICSLQRLPMIEIIIVNQQINLFILNITTNNNIKSIFAKHSTTDSSNNQEIVLLQTQLTIAKTGLTQQAIQCIITLSFSTLFVFVLHLKSKTRTLFRIYLLVLDSYMQILINLMMSLYIFARQLVLIRSL